MRASEHYIREMDKAMQKLQSIAIPNTSRASAMKQKSAVKPNVIRLPGGCLLYRLPGNRFA